MGKRGGIEPKIFFFFKLLLFPHGFTEHHSALSFLPKFRRFAYKSSQSGDAYTRTLPKHFAIGHKPHQGDARALDINDTILTRTAENRNLQFALDMEQESLFLDKAYGQICSSTGRYEH